MSFLKNILKNSYRDGGPTPSRSSFTNLTEAQLEEHLSISRYGSFLLTDAVRPAFSLEVVPSAGYRYETFEDENSGTKVPVIMAAQTRERLIDLFVELIDPLGDEVDVVLETSHEGLERQHRDLYRESIELPILKSILYDFEELLLDDGCTGLAVLNPRIPLEVQFDEHKLLIMYGHDLSPFEDVLRGDGLRVSESIRFITEGEHIHSSTEDHQRQFESLCYQLGVEN